MNDIRIEAKASVQNDLEGAPVIETHWRGKTIRPTRVSESISRNIAALRREDSIGWRRTITVSGPVQTKSGRDHASQRDKVSYREGEIPDWLAPHLVGTEALLAALRGYVAQG